MHFLFGIAIRVFLNSISLLGSKFYLNFIERLIHFANSNKKFNVIITILTRPKKISGIQSAFPAILKNRTAILVQGPLISSDDFTFNTLLLYTKIFNGSLLLFSTWDDLEEKQLQKLISIGVKVVFSKRPSICGFLNFNLQLVTTQKGLYEIKKLGIETVLKTRSDQRIYNKLTLEYLGSLSRKFPSSSRLNCNSRIFILSQTTLCNVPFHVCDMLQYGFIDDVINFWSVMPHKHNVSRGNYEKTILGKRVLSDYFKDYNTTLPEITLGIGYANKLYSEIEVQKNYKQAYLNLLREAIGVIDQSHIDLVWPKYYAYEGFSDYNVSNALMRISFDKWLIINMSKNDNIVDFTPALAF